jgi:hypothetical protein
MSLPAHSQGTGEASALGAPVMDIWGVRSIANKPRKQGFHHEGTKNTKKALLHFVRYMNGHPRSTKSSCLFVFFVPSWWNPCLLVYDARLQTVGRPTIQRKVKPSGGSFGITTS